jgi:succinyl-diaminopimelate desuccinylase
MSFNKIIREAELAKKEVAELCSKLIQFNSAHPEGRTDECVSYIKDYMDKHGIKTEIHSKTPTKPNIVAKIPGKSKRRILWVGHLDVVPEGKPETWTYPPYSGKITSDGLIYGRGSTDMKGSCAAAMVSARILSELKEPIPNETEFWFTADEEIGGGDGAKWLSETKRFKADVCVIGDSEGGDLEKPSIDIGCKGGLPTKLIAKGKTAHGSTPFLGDNAIKKLMKAIPYVEKIAEYKLELPPELNKALKSSTDFLLEIQNLNEKQKKDAKRAFYYPTVSCNIISGGVKRNVIPDYAEAEFDIRLTPGSKPLKVKQRLEEIIKEANIPGISTDITASEKAGYYESPNTTFAHQLSETVEKVTGHKPTFKILTGGTDAISIESYAKIPCLGYGPLMTGQAHQPDEHESIDSLVLGVKVFAAFTLIYRG